MRHRTPGPRPSSLRCVNAVGACVFITLALAAPAEVKAQSVAPVSEAPVDLGEVVVTAGRTPLTIARARATRTPGGASVIATADFEAEGAVILADGFDLTPDLLPYEMQDATATGAANETALAYFDRALHLAPNAAVFAAARDALVAKYAVA